MTDDNRSPSAGASSAPWRNKRVAVLMGGLSSEREVSLRTGAGVMGGLRERGYECTSVDWAPGTSLAELLLQAKPDVVWNALHGTYGEDGSVQGLLSCMGIPCTGSGILASALAMDKVMSKRIFSSGNIPTPSWIIVPRDADEKTLLGYGDHLLPFVIKPAKEGSSVGVSIVTRREEIIPAVELARRYPSDTMLETFISGTEIHVGILGESVLGSIEVRPAVQFYNYEAKYKRDDTQYIIPPTIDQKAVRFAEELALGAFARLGCTGYARVDLRVKEDGAPYVLEVNTLPGMTSHSLLPKIAAHAGMDYPTLCERILSSAQ